MTAEPTFGDVLSEVQGAIAAGNYDRAIALTDKLLLAYPDALSVWRARAQAFSASGRPFQASEAYQRVLDIAPADVNAMKGLALALSAMGKRTEAKLVAQQALDYEPGDKALLAIAAPSDGGDSGRSDIGARLRDGMNDVQAGLLDRGIARLKQVAAHCPDRADVLALLAHALWRAGLRVAAAETCQSLLDIQPDCLNAHALLLALWRPIGPPGLDQAHLSAIARLDPDHSHVKALLGDDSPLEVVSVPAFPPSPIRPAPRASEALDREDWVDDLIAAASSAPRPLERDDVLIASASIGPAEADVGDDAPQADDAEAIGEADAFAESLIPLEWEEAEDWPEERGEVAPAWLADQPAGFVPTRSPLRATNADEGAPTRVEPLEWEAGESPTAAPAFESLPSAADKVAAARRAIQQGRWQEAVGLYEKVIASRRGKALDEIIADLEAVRALQPATRAVHELLGLAYARRGDVDAALDAYHRAMKLLESA
ncbi:MAG: tetratricopeptide repeat protein [Thermoflexales bacterium]|nr:tetratricopeptide repeat protein [Thermoflexales bacterium]